MRRLSIREHERIPIGLPEGLSHEEAARLRRFDERYAEREGDTVFDWTRLSFVVAREHVGVVQIPGLAVEILPKTDKEARAAGAQRNLLYMLETAGWVKARARSLALLEREAFSLLDAFVIVFADHLIDTLRNGMDRRYVSQEENLRVVRGRLLVHEHVRRNAVQRQRLFVRYDAFLPNTPLNRVLKAASQYLVRRVSSFEATRRLREILHRFDEVDDVLTPADLDVTLDRQNERFRPHFDFARLVLGGRWSPSPARGGEASFSLLLPMSRVFEAFVGHFLRRHRAGLGLSDVHVELQGGGRHLMRDENGKRYFGLYPDVLGRRPDGSIGFVLDTKWKLLRGGGRVDDISMSDAYQIYAYGERFDAPVNVLLYPYVEGARDVDLLFEGSDRLLRVGFVNVSKDLRKHEAELVAELAAILSPTYRQQTDRVTA